MCNLSQIYPKDYAMPKRYQDNIGCFVAFFRAIVGASRQAEPWPYRVRDDFLSPAEVAFYRVLKVAVGDSLTIFSKVRIADILFVARKTNKVFYRNKIDRKHLDFLLCHPVTLKPVLGIELDDSSHLRPDRIARDQFVDAAFAAAKLPLLHVPVKAGYSVHTLREQLGQIVYISTQSAAPVAADTGQGEVIPQCPKCNSRMVLRWGRKLPASGMAERFWGCENYPMCRETRVL